MFSFIKKLFRQNKIDLGPIIRHGAIILDVRTTSEYRQGHIPGSKNIPVDEIGSQMDSIRNWNKPVITVCHSGARSHVATGILRSGGIEAYNGGAWSKLSVR